MLNNHCSSFFLIHNAFKVYYTLNVDSYYGDAGDAFTLGGHSGCKFSTFDRDNDNKPTGNCAETYKGGWW